MLSLKNNFRFGGMMRPNSVPEGNLLISLDTMDPVNAEQSLAFMHALLFHLRQIPEIGPGARIEIVNLSRGTIWAQVAIIVGTLIAGAGIIKVAVESIQTELEQGDGPLAKETVRTLNNYRGDNCTIITLHQEVAINIQVMSVRENVAGEPPAAPEGFVYARKGGAYVREGSEFVFAPKSGGNSRLKPSARADKVFTNIPPEGFAELAGEVISSNGELRFVQPDGSYGRIDDILSGDQPPHGVAIVAKVTATRGEQGGYADRGIRMHSWRPLEAESPGSIQSSKSRSPQPPLASPEMDQDQARYADNARPISLVGQLDNSFGRHSFEFLAKNGDTYFAEEADNFEDMLALGRDVFIEATLTETEEGPLLYIHRLIIID